MCIYAILAVEFFGKFGAEKCDGASALADTDCWENINGMSIQLVTARGFTYGSEYYGTFFRALYTLFQVMTGESWSEAVARPLVFSKEHSIVAALFHVTFVIFCGVVLVNVAVAVLLEKMVSPDSDPQDEDDELGLHWFEVKAKPQDGVEVASPALAKQLTTRRKTGGALPDKIDLTAEELAKIEEEMGDEEISRNTVVQVEGKYYRCEKSQRSKIEDMLEAKWIAFKEELIDDLVAQMEPDEQPTKQAEAKGDTQLFSKADDQPRGLAGPLEA